MSLITPHRPVPAQGQLAWLSLLPSAKLQHGGYRAPQPWELPTCWPGGLNEYSQFLSVPWRGIGGNHWPTGMRKTQKQETELERCPAPHSSPLTAARNPGLSTFCSGRLSRQHYPSTYSGHDTGLQRTPSPPEAPFPTFRFHSAT